MAETKAKRVPYFTTSTTVDVDIDPDDLHDAGWHHENECGIDVSDEKDMAALPVDDLSALGAAVASLHRQAHPSQSRSVRLCREEPCRSLSLDQLGQVDAA
jgi:hypothetical protein